MKRRWWIVAIAVLLLAGIAGGGGWWWWSTRALEVRAAAPAGGATLTPLAVELPRDAGPPPAPVVMVMPDAGVQVVDLGAHHACTGTWRGALRQSDGITGQGTVVVTDVASERCGTLNERWNDGTVCHYRFYACAPEGDRLRMRASSGNCPAIRLTLGCTADRMRFFEDDGTVTVSSTMQRSRP